MSHFSSTAAGRGKNPWKSRPRASAVVDLITLSSDDEKEDPKKKKAKIVSASNVNQKTKLSDQQPNAESTSTEFVCVKTEVASNPVFPLATAVGSDAQSSTVAATNQAQILVPPDLNSSVVSVDQRHSNSIHDTKTLNCSAASCSSATVEAGGDFLMQNRILRILKHPSHFGAAEVHRSVTNACSNISIQAQSAKVLAYDLEKKSDDSSLKQEPSVPERNPEQMSLEAHSTNSVVPDPQTSYSPNAQFLIEHLKTLNSPCKSVGRDSCCSLDVTSFPFSDMDEESDESVLSCHQLIHTEVYDKLSPEQKQEVDLLILKCASLEMKMKTMAESEGVLGTEYCRCVDAVMELRKKMIALAGIPDAELTIEDEEDHINKFKFRGTRVRNLDIALTEYTKRWMRELREADRENRPVQMFISEKSIDKILNKISVKFFNGGPVKAKNSDRKLDKASVFHLLHNAVKKHREVWFQKNILPKYSKRIWKEEQNDSERPCCSKIESQRKRTFSNKPNIKELSEATALSIPNSAQKSLKATSICPENEDDTDCVTSNSTELAVPVPVIQQAISDTQMSPSTAIIPAVEIENEEEFEDYPPEVTVILKMFKRNLIQI